MIRCSKIRQKSLKYKINEEHGMDFCCNGWKALSVACSEKELDPDVILQELRRLDETRHSASFKCTKWTFTGSDPSEVRLRRPPNNPLSMDHLSLSATG
jgi:hypothetical protein